MGTEESSKLVCSFEFFPPKTPEGALKLRSTWKQLGQLHPPVW